MKKIIKRNFPLIVLFLVFIGLLDFLWQVEPYKAPPADNSEAATEQNVKTFMGRMDMPNLDDIYVLENSAERDVEALEKFIVGRAAGLHWLGQEHFKKKNASDIRVGLHLVVDSMGVFTCKKILFSDADDAAFEKQLTEYIEYYWRYKKSQKGITEFWIPLRWKAKVSKN
jgi:hypothetical protein